jgi:hypothetical protein
MPRNSVHSLYFLTEFTGFDRTEQKRLFGKLPLIRGVPIKARGTPPAADKQSVSDKPHDKSQTPEVDMDGVPSAKNTFRVRITPTPTSYLLSRPGRPFAGLRLHRVFDGGDRKEWTEYGNGARRGSGSEAEAHKQHKYCRSFLFHS